MPEIDFIEESTPIDFQPEPIDFQPVVDFQPEPIPEPRFDPSLMEPAKTPEELAARNLASTQEIRKQVPGYDVSPPVKSITELATDPLAHLVSPQELADAIDVIKTTFSYDPMAEESAALVQEELAQPSRKPTTTEEIAAGVQTVAAELTTSPLALSTAGMGALPKTAQKLLTYGFTAQQVAHLPEAIREAQAAKTPYERTTAYLRLAADIAIPAAVATHEGLSLIQKRATDIKAAQVGPATEAAVKTGVESPGPGAASPAEFPEMQSLDFSTKRFLPDFLERSKEREVFSQPFAWGRIPIIGRLLDPNAKVNSYEQQALAAYAAAREGVGPAHASRIGSQYGPEIREAFKASETGDLNVEPRTAGQSLKISDVFESLQRNPESYNLTPEQRRVWSEVIDPILKEKKELVDKYELAQTEDANGDLIGHFHRIVTEFPKGKEPTVTRTGQSVGTKIPSQRGRVFRRSEAEGWEKGYKYELDPVKRLVSDIERTYKAIADKRLIEDPVFGGTTRTQFESQLREVFSEELASGEISEKSFQNILDNKVAQGRVYQPGFSGTIFEPQTAKLLNDTLQAGDSRLRKVIATGNDFAKAMALGFDLGVGQLQLLPTFFRRPDIWAKANWQSLKAIFKPESFSEYLSAHETAARELAEAGSSVGQLQEYLSGVRPGQAITRIPGVGQLAKAFGRQFQTALDTAKIQLWEAWREVTPPDQRLSVIRTIESQLNMGRMESIGVGGRQALTERVLLLAPSYYRGAVNYVAAMAEPGVSGKIARQGISAFIGGGLAMFYGVGKMLGMEDEELQKRLNPSRPDFMQWVIEGEGGRKINVGIGGIHRSLIRLAGNMYKTSIEHPENWASLSTEKNPITRWLRGHGALLPTATLTALSGRDFMGQEADIGTVTGGFLPLTAQQFFRREGEPPVTVPELAASFLGLNAYPESVRNQYLRERDDKAQKERGRGFEELPLNDQVRIARELNAKEPFNAKTPASARQIQQAFKNSVERVERITAALPEEVQNSLKSSGVHITGYEPSISIGRDKLLLTENQQQRYEQLIIEEYSKQLTKIKFSQVERMDSEQRQKYINRILEPAKTKAKMRLIQELRKPLASPR